MFCFFVFFCFVFWFMYPFFYFFFFLCFFLTSKYYLKFEPSFSVIFFACHDSFQRGSMAQHAIKKALRLCVQDRIRKMTEEDKIRESMAIAVKVSSKLLPMRYYCHYYHLCLFLSSLILCFDYSRYYSYY
jgi:hypothetical protein